MTRFRADLYRNLRRGDFRRADTLYAVGLDAACAFLTGHRGYHDPGSPAPPPEAPHAPGTTEPAEAGLPPLYPFDWADLAGLRGHLVSVVTGSTSPDHTLALIRGTQAGFLRHGLLLEAATGTARHRGPGFSDIPLTPDTAERIRSRVLHPTTAAALALLLLTDLPLSTLETLTLGDLSADASQLTVTDPTHPREGAVDVPIPPFAVDLLDAARHYIHLTTRPSPAAPLLSEDSRYLDVWNLRAAAITCEFDLPDLQESLSWERAWYLRARCSWVGPTVHGNRHLRPERKRGAYVPQA